MSGSPHRRRPCAPRQRWQGQQRAKDPRYAWFVKNYGKRCWELDAQDPNDLRACVKKAIEKQIEPVAWKRCEIVNQAEQASLKTILAKWGAP